MSTLILDTTTKTIKVAMSSAAATVNPDFIVSYADNNGTVFTEASSDGALTGATDATVVAAPASGYRRVIKSLFIENKDTAAVTITVKYDNNGTQRTIAKVTLQVGDTWSTDGTYDTYGALKQTLGTVNLSSVTGILGTANGGTGTTTATGTGFVVLATSPTLVTPNLGTPSALVGTNITGTAAGLTAGTVTTNANLTGGVTSVGNAATVITNANLTGPITSVGNATSIASKTGTGTTFVMDTSPTLITPALGTPSALVGTNITGTASGLTAGNVTTNANLTGPITSVGNATSVASQTGTGSKFVMDTSPTLVTPALGTPTSATLTNATGLPLTTGVTGTLAVANGGTGVTSSTGTGSVVLSTTPGLSNPTITNYTETAYVANTSSAFTVALANGTVQILTLTANTTITMPAAGAGKSFVIILRQDGTGSRTVTWSTVNWPAGTAPTITSTASKQDIFSFFSDGTSWYGITVSQNYTQ